MSIYDAARHILCIVQPAPNISPVKLSCQYLTVLSAGGVPHEVFQELQRDAVKKKLEVLADISGWWGDGPRSQAGRNGRLRLAAALGVAGGLGVNTSRREAAGASRALGFSQREWDDDETDDASNNGGTGSTRMDIWQRDETSGYAPLKHEELRIALLQGIDIVRSRHLSDIWTYAVEDSIRNIVGKVKLPVARSAGGFLQPGQSSWAHVLAFNNGSPISDWTGVLEEGEIVFIPGHDFEDPDSGLPVTAITGDVIVSNGTLLLVYMA
jgi:RNA dependent RNA polymerase